MAATVMITDLDRFELALLSLDTAACANVMASASRFRSEVDLLDGLVVPALVRIGQRWDHGEVALSQVYHSGRLCQRLVQSRPRQPGPLRPDQPRMAIGILDDVHVLGKEIVLQMLRSAGYEVADWGARLSVADLVERVARDDVEVLFLSTLMLRSALQVPRLRAELERTSPRTRIVVGGAPFRFDPALGEEVGAHRVGMVASDALLIVGEFAAGSAARPT